jgi:predicted lipoprotein with Yx(FWY)xxD motif
MIEINLMEGMTMRIIRILNMVLLTFVASAILGVGLASAAALNIKVKDGIGSYLVDDKGMTLYLFKKDAPGKSVCASGGCLEKWPIYYAEKIEPADGIDATAIGVITRDDGKKQSTYRGLPLYYFIKDKDGDDVYGQGVNNVWFVVAP